MKSIVNLLTKCISLFLILTLLVTAIYLSGCNNEPGFGIYLVESGELVLSEHHIEGYNWDSHAIELNEEGIEKWNSYLTSGAVPQTQDTLFQDEFVVKVRGKEIYGGEFYSLVSSGFYPGVVILDALMILDESRNTIVINFGYPGSFQDAGEDPRDNQELFDYLDSQGLLKPG